MSVYLETYQFIIDNINIENKTISILRITVITRDSVEVARNKHRAAFVPGEIAQVKEYMGIETGPEIDYLNAIWTQEVIDNYNAMIEEQQLG